MGEGFVFLACNNTDLDFYIVLYIQAAHILMESKLMDCELDKLKAQFALVTHSSSESI